MHSQITPAEPLMSREVNGLLITEFRQPANLHIPRHYHEFAGVLFVYGGFVAENMARKTHECGPSTILIRPAGEVHTHHYGHDGAHCLLVQVKTRESRSDRQLKVLDEPACFRDGSMTDLALRLYAEFRIMDEASDLAVEGLLLELMARAIRISGRPKGMSPKPRWLLRAEDFIRENYSTNVRLSDVAREAGVNPAHLAEVFRKHHGSTVGQYVRRLRLDKALEELITTERTIAEISSDAGFCDQSHFTKFFKRHAGLTPMSVRNAARTPKAHSKSRG